MSAETGEASLEGVPEPEPAAGGSEAEADDLGLLDTIKKEFHDMIHGGKLSVQEVKEQIMMDIILSMSVFVITELGTSFFAPYWRPVAYDIGWAVLGALTAIVGVVAVSKESSFGVAAFTILLIMLACLNIAHTLTMRSEHVMVCRMNQMDFKHCNSFDSPSLAVCLPKNDCTRSEVEHTKCRAPGKEHCAHMDSMDAVFIFNMLVSFFTFSEPAYWGMIFHARLENRDLTDRVHLVEQNSPEMRPLLSPPEEIKVDSDPEGEEAAPQSAL